MMLFRAPAKILVQKGLLFLCLVLLSSCSQDIERVHKFAHLMPKTDLHVHLEGSIPLTTLFQLAQKNHVASPLSQVNHETTFKTFEPFLALYAKVTDCFKTPQDYELIAYEFGKACARQNILYAEVIFSMGPNCKSSGLDWNIILDALNRGRARAQDEFGVSWMWLLDLLPNDLNYFQPHDFVARVIQSRNAGKGVVGLSVSEELVTHHGAAYQDVFDLAIAEKLPIVAHAGEFENAGSIWQALNRCRSTRVDHGVACIHDKRLMQELRNRQVALDVCVTSNVRLGVFHSYKEHPIRTLWDAGILVTVNTDDATLLNTDLNKEYDHLIDDYHFTCEELERVSLHGIQASFLRQEEKEVLMKKFKKAFAALRREIF